MVKPISLLQLIRIFRTANGRKRFHEKRQIATKKKKKKEKEKKKENLCDIFFFFEKNLRHDFQNPEGVIESRKGYISLTNKQKQDIAKLVNQHRSCLFDIFDIPFPFY